MDSLNHGKSDVLMTILRNIPLSIMVPFCRHFKTKYSFVHSSIHLTEVKVHVFESLSHHLFDNVILVNLFNHSVSQLCLQYLSHRAGVTIMS